MEDGAPLEATAGYNATRGLAQVTRRLCRSEDGCPVKMQVDTLQQRRNPQAATKLKTHCGSDAKMDRMGNRNIRLGVKAITIWT